MWPQGIDAFLIYGYRLPDNPVAGFYLGTGVLAFLSVLAGELVQSFVYLANRRIARERVREMTRMHNLSMQALKAGDGDGYRACNKEANEAFGRTFFLRIAMGASLLWPIPLALDWMSLRFAGIRFKLPVSVPLFGDTVGYVFVFILVYVLVRMGFQRMKPVLPYFRWVRRRLNENADAPASLEPWMGEVGNGGEGKARWESR